MHKRPVWFVPDGSFVFMNEIIKEYLEWKGTYAPRASLNYRIWLNRLVEVCGEKALHEYDVSDYAKYHQWLRGRYCPWTVQFAIVVIKNFLQFCKTQNYNCLSPTLVKLPRAIAKSHRAITEDEFHLIVSVIPSFEFRILRDLIMIRMLWDTGVRVSELTDLDTSQISEGKRSTVIQTKKNGKKRIIMWSEETHGLLMKYLPLRLSLEKSHNASALFIGFKKGRGWSMRINTRSIQRIVEYYVNRAGIKSRISPHSFRHGWAHKRRDLNAPLSFIQRGLGHVSPVSTFVYEQYCDTEFEKNANSYLKTA